MGPHMPGEKIHPTQVLWQVFEVVMNAWILYTIITVGVTVPLIIWTAFEIVMNAWILFTMIKIRKGKKYELST